MTDMYIHVVDRDNNIIDPNEVVEVVDSNYDTLSKVYIDAGNFDYFPNHFPEK